MTPEKSRECANELIAQIARVKVPHRPVPWFLDVDGVLNAFSKGAQGWDDPWHYEVFNQTVDRIRYRITFAPELIRVINLLSNERYVEIHWLTTWQDEANGRLMTKLGLAGPFPVLINPTKLGAYGILEKNEDTEDEYGSWWKLARIREQLSADPTMRAIWTDDDLPYERGAGAYLQTVPGRVLTVAPQPAFGLTPANMREILNFVDDEQRA